MYYLLRCKLLISQVNMKTVLVAVAAAAVLTTCVAAIIVWQVVDWDKDDMSQPEEEFESELGVYTQAAVATDAPYCSDVGKYVYTTT